MTAKEFLEATFEPNNKYCVRFRAVCADGFSVSIQGGTSMHYCNPRRHCNEYNSVELGYPSEADDLIMDYAENAGIPTGTVYGFVPIDVVEQLVGKHGGIVNNCVTCILAA